MQGIYKIINKLNNKFYIGSTSNTDRREKDHFLKLAANNHRNKYLQAAYNKYGKENFEFVVVKELPDATKEELFSEEQNYLNVLSREISYNLTYLAGGGGSDVIEIPTYLLDLNYNIIEEFPSVMKAYKFIGGKTQPDYSRLNSGFKFKKNYRVVTKEFYKNHFDIIQSWIKRDERIKEKKLTKIYSKIKKKEDRCILIDYNNETLEFPTVSETARFIGISRQLVDNRLRRAGARDKYNIRYKTRIDDRKSKKYIVVRVEDKETFFDSLTEAAKFLGVHRTTLKNSLRGKTKKNKYDVKYRIIS